MQDYSKGARTAFIVGVLIAGLAFPLAAQQPATRDQQSLEQQLKADITRISGPLFEMLGSERVFTDPQLRAAMAPRALPALREIIALVQQAANRDPRMASSVIEFQMMAAALGDGEARRALEAAVVQPAPIGSQAKGYLLLVDWYHAGGDAGAQRRVLDQFAAAVKASPDQPYAAMLLRIYPRAASPALAGRIETLLGEFPAGVREEALIRLQSAKKLAGLVGKPLVIAGKTSGDAPFSSNDWKGKVILVDFWAMWCGPCVQQLPKLKSLYAAHRVQGLEIVGVSSDRDLPTLKAGVTEHALLWPQLFDPKTATGSFLHPIANELGIQGLPTMLLIDRNGIVRTVRADEDLEELLPRLLAEPPGRGTQQ